MISAETFKCTVPSANAIKDASITCVTEATHWPDNMTAWATVVLAIFAIAAWLTAQKTLGKMEYQIRTQENRAIDERQHAYLVDYLIALKTLANNVAVPESDWEELETNATDKWMIWSMDLLREDTEMHKLTGIANHFFRTEGKALRAEHKKESDAFQEAVLMHVMGSMPDSEFRKAQLDQDAQMQTIENHKRNTSAYIQLLQRWQTKRSTRPDEAAELRIRIDSM